MAKVTITLEDADDGGVDVHSVYDPPLGENGEPTPAQDIAMALAHFASTDPEDLIEG